MIYCGASRETNNVLRSPRVTLRPRSSYTWQSMTPMAYAQVWNDEQGESVVYRSVVRRSCRDTPDTADHNYHR
jgi:hypothetical protein